MAAPWSVRLHDLLKADWMGRKKSVAGQNRDSPRSTIGRPSQDNANSIRDSEKVKREYEAFARDFAERLTRLADARDGKSSFSRETGLSTASVSDYTNGKQIPGGEKIMRIVAATGCDPAWLLTGRGTMFPADDATTTEGRARVAAAPASGATTPPRPWRRCRCRSTKSST